jgi:hypothetical protein
MDILSLRKYCRQSTLIDREFLEFFVNDKPLSELLDKFYGIKGSILDNWIGILGSFGNHKSSQQHNYARDLPALAADCSNLILNAEYNIFIKEKHQYESR